MHEQNLIRPARPELLRPAEALRRAKMEGLSSDAPALPQTVAVGRL